MKESVSYSRRARLRLALSDTYAEISDHCRGLVPTYSDGYAHGGELLDSADEVLSAARRLVELAVAYERSSGTSWQTIGEVLDVSRQAAHERYAGYVEELNKNLAVSWALDDPRYPDVPDGAGDPAETAERLDRWVAARLQPTDSLAHENEQRRAHAVSIGLPEHSLPDMTNLFLTVANVLASGVGPKDERATDELRVAFARRKVELMEALVAEETAEPGRTGTDMESLRDQLAGARARLAELVGADETSEMYPLLECSECGARFEEAGARCPNCGARTPE